MHIVLDGRGVANALDGIGRYSINLIRGLAQADANSTWTVLVREHLATEIRALFPASVTLKALPYPHLHWRTVGTLGRTIEKTGTDIYHSLFMLHPRACRTPGIVTIHDTMWLARPHLQIARRPVLRWLGMHYHRVLVGASVRAAARVVVVSETSRQDVLALWPSLVERTSVIGEGIDPCFTPGENTAVDRAALRKSGVPDAPFVLHVTNGKPYKNTLGLLDAFDQAREQCDLHMVLAGRRSRESGGVEDRIARLGLQERIHCLGPVDNVTMLRLYRAARFLAFPSLYEGFGLPIVEAMACGCPVLTSDRGAMKEVADEAAYIVDPEDLRSMGEGLIRLCEEERLRSDLIRRGRERAQAFRWDAVAQAVLALYRDMVSNKSG